MRTVRLALLCLMTALLPLDGLARLSQPACASHGDAAMTADREPAHASHRMHAAMTMATTQAPRPSMAAADMLASSDPPRADHAGAHDDCRCAGVCAVHCAVSATVPAWPALAGTAFSRSEVPAIGDSCDPQPARRLDLLRPPTGALA